MSSRGLPASGPQKLKKESKKSQKVEISTLFQVKKWKFQLFFNFFDSFSTLFLTFGALGPVLQDTKEYLNRTFPGAKKRGDEGGGEEGRSGARMHRA